MTTTDAPTEALPVPAKSYRTLIRIVAVAALVAVAVAGAGVAWAAHVHGVYDRKDEAYRLLAIRTDTAKTKAKSAHRREVAALTMADAKALKKAVAKQKVHDTRVMKRVVRRWKSRARREAAAAAAAGYSSGNADGNAAGYSSGHSSGVTEGARRATDQVVCSDDPDVTWLPYCY